MPELICTGSFLMNTQCNNCRRCKETHDKLKKFAQAVNAKLGKGQDLDFDSVVIKDMKVYFMKDDHPSMVMTEDFFKQFLKR